MKKSILRFMIPKSLVEYINSDSSVRQALEKMHFHKYTAIPVLDSKGKYIGTLSNDDIIDCIMRDGVFNKFEAEEIPVEKILKASSVKPLMHNASIEDLIDSVKEHNFVPIVDDRGCFIGIILRREILGRLLTHINEI